MGGGRGARVVLLGESGPSKGWGHARRLSVLAGEFMARGYRCELLLTDISVKPDFLNGDVEFYMWRPESACLPDAGIVVFDGYEFDGELVSRWKAESRVVAQVDDNGDGRVGVDVIINPNIFGGLIEYPGDEFPKVLKGPQFALIDRSFVELGARLRQHGERVLVSFGGTDRGKLSGALARALLRRSPSVTIDIMLATTPRACNEAYGLEESDRLRIYRSGGNMLARMADADVYAGGAGVTLLEAMAAGLKVVVCSVAGNQSRSIEALAKYGAPAFAEFCPDAMAEGILRSLAGPKPIGLPVIDGLGAARAIDQIEPLVSRG